MPPRRRGSEPAFRAVWDETREAADLIDRETRRSDYSSRFSWHPILGGEARVYVEREHPHSSSWDILNPGDAVVRAGGDQDDPLTIEQIKKEQDASV